MLIGYIDSLALNIDNGILAKIREFGVIITVKNGLDFDKELLKRFKLKRLPLYDYLALLYTERGLEYKLTKHITAKTATLTFQGLRQYTEISKLMREDLKDVIAIIGKDNLIFARIDIAIDKDAPFNIARIASALKREPKRYKRILLTLKQPKRAKQTGILM
ncbi:MAG: hypothetical protein LBF13_04200 [Campylobacteraceae bacterium]|jgi:hypothetical protein|nr:hypothetical protein [Campylobacteraceae bacterium]